MAVGKEMIVLLLQIQTPPVNPDPAMMKIITIIVAIHQTNLSSSIPKETHDNKKDGCQE